MECFQTALEIAAAVLTPLLAVTVIFTSIRQYRLSSQRLNFDVRLTLLDKRLGAFRGMQRFIAGVCENPDLISKQNLYDYVRETSFGEFIFDETRKDIFLKIYNKARKLLSVNQRVERLKMQGRKEDEEYLRCIEEGDNLFGWFKDRLAKNEDDFRDYFEFK